MNYKKVLTRYIQGRLSELSNVDAYESNKLALTNLLWFLGKAASNEVIVAKLKIMDGADIKKERNILVGMMVTNHYMMMSIPSQ